MAHNVKQEPVVPQEVARMELKEGDHKESNGFPKNLTEMGLYESIKHAASADTKPNRNAAMIGKLESESRQYERYNDFDEPNQDSPDRTMADFYCNICDAHMNSEQMWESHVSGKRHLKNIKKVPGEMPSKVKAIKTTIPPKLMDAIKDVDLPLVGLNFMTELQRAEPGLNPSYTCHLCQANLTRSVVIEHILGTKHRLAFLKEAHPNQYRIMENMELSKTALDHIVEDRSREYERKDGCGIIQVKLEKPKIGPPPPRQQDLHLRRSRSRSISSESRREKRHAPDAYYYKQPRRNRSRSPPGCMYSFGTQRKGQSSENGRWRHDRCSADARLPSSSSSDIKQMRWCPDFSNLEWSQRIALLEELTDNMILVSDDEVQQAKDVMKSISRSIFQYAVRKLPEAIRNKLTKKLERDFHHQDFGSTLNQAIHATQDRDSSRRRHRSSSSSSSSSSSDHFY